jgi:hypothetical protein
MTRKGLHLQSIQSYQLTSPVNVEEFRNFFTGNPKSDGVYIQGARMKGIQNKIIISQKAFITYICGLHHYKGKLSKFLSI